MGFKVDNPGAFYGSQVLTALASRSQNLAAAESCTGGGILKTLTDIPGSSAVVWGGVVAYTNEAKQHLLSVPAALLAKQGAVSIGAASSMAWGMRVVSGADWTVAVTGIAGPGGGTREKKVGTVCIAWCSPNGKVEAERYWFNGNRQEVREQAIVWTFKELLIRIDKN